MAVEVKKVDNKVDFLNLKIGDVYYHPGQEQYLLVKLNKNGEGNAAWLHRPDEDFTIGTTCLYDKVIPCRIVDVTIQNRELN